MPHKQTPKQYRAIQRRALQQPERQIKQKKNEKIDSQQ